MAGSRYFLWDSNRGQEIEIDAAHYCRIAILKQRFPKSFAKTQVRRETSTVVMVPNCHTTPTRIKVEVRRVERR